MEKVEALLTYAENIVELEPKLLHSLRVCHTENDCGLILDNIATAPLAAVWKALYSAELEYHEQETSSSSFFFGRKRKYDDISSAIKDGGPHSLLKEYDVDNNKDDIYVSTLQYAEDLGSKSSLNNHIKTDDVVLAPKNLFPVDDCVESTHCDEFYVFLEGTGQVEKTETGFVRVKSPTIKMGTESAEFSQGYPQMPFTYSSFHGSSCDDSPLPDNSPFWSQTSISVGSSQVRAPVPVPSISVSAEQSLADPLCLAEWQPILWTRTHIYNLPSPVYVSEALQRDSHIVYHVRACFRAKDNLALHAAIWLANRLQKPLVAVVFVDTVACSDCADVLDDSVASSVHKVPDHTHFMRPSANSHQSDEQSSALSVLRRKSATRLSVCAAVQRDLATVGVPLLCLVAASRSVSEFDLLCALCSANPVSSAVGQFQLGGAVALFTDDFIHPVSDMLQTRISAELPALPVFAVDCNSLLVQRHKRPHRLEATDSVRDSWISQDVFEILFDEGYAHLREESSRHSARSQWQPCQASLNQQIRGLSIERAEILTSHCMGSSLVLRSLDFSEVQAFSASSSVTTLSLSSKLSEATVDCTYWSETTASSWLRSVLSATTESSSEECEIMYNAQFQEFLWLGLLSPLDIADCLGELVTRHGGFRRTVREAEFARYVCVAYREQICSDAQGSPSWFDLLPSSTVDKIHCFSIEDHNSQGSTNAIYPYSLRNGSTDNSQFNCIQKRLVDEAVVPCGENLTFWLSFLFASLPSIEVAVRAAFIEVAAHCRHDLSSAFGGCGDGGFIVAVSFLGRLDEALLQFEMMCAKRK